MSEFDVVSGHPDKQTLLRTSSGIALAFGGVKQKSREHIISGIDINGDAVSERVSDGCSVTSFKSVTRIRLA